MITTALPNTAVRANLPKAPAISIFSFFIRPSALFFCGLFQITGPPSRVFLQNAGLSCLHLLRRNQLRAGLLDALARLRQRLARQGIGDAEGRRQAELGTRHDDDVAL